MLLFTLLVFILTATGGAYLLSYVLADKETPKGIAILHGSLGALGIILLAINGYYYPWLLTLFILVALGGFFLIVTDLSGKKIPKLVALGHGLLALVGIILLGITVARFM